VTEFQLNLKTKRKKRAERKEREALHLGEESPW
jgi:hypothetical protein